MRNWLKFFGNASHQKIVWLGIFSIVETRLITAIDMKQYAIGMFAGSLFLCVFMKIQLAPYQCKNRSIRFLFNINGDFQHYFFFKLKNTCDFLLLKDIIYKMMTYKMNDLPLIVLQIFVMASLFLKKEKKNYICQ